MRVGSLSNTSQSSKFTAPASSGFPAEAAPKKRVGDMRTSPDYWLKGEEKEVNDGFRIWTQCFGLL
jgi:hypothetical protein